MEARSAYRTLPIIMLAMWLAGGTWANAQMDIEGSGFSLKNYISYGNCAAATRVDMLTDEEHPTLLCGQQTASSRINAISILADPEGPFEVRLDTGEQSHPHDDITVAIRIDKRPLTSRTAYWRKGTYYHVAVIPDPTLARFLLDELATGRRVVLRVGVTQGHIDLHGSAAAIADFRRRIRS